MQIANIKFYVATHTRYVQIADIKFYVAIHTLNYIVYSRDNKNYFSENTNIYRNWHICMNKHGMSIR